ncbi:MAG: helicase c2, partial [Spirochaetia bacterium]|nr:helicase c2 [Spirochaetia bacterium]
MLNLNIEKRFSARIIKFIRSAIAEAGGNEVMFSGRLGKGLVVDEITLAARGNRNSVPVIEPFIEAGDVIIHNHPSGNLMPSDADMSIASEIGSHGLGFYIVDNEVTRVYVVAEIIRKKQ